ncbi:MAG: glycoside hydrolase family 3 C-terminal domain-containing protein [Clostridia bacterium]|nr:glycoside hydrolase family 3 C-terminal domain-containing protein [Clostridia bacterium]
MDIRKIISEMTLEEKAALCQGKNSWETVGVPRLGIPSVWLSDGPIGVRKEIDGKDENGENMTEEAVCFPAMVGIAASFDPELAHFAGNTVAEAGRGLGVDVLLGPAMNIKRSPLCGRNFEYASEDPYLAGQIGAAYIKGVQEKGVGTSLKHFAANSQETRRFSVDERISERALREIYLAAFENSVRDGKPWTVMCSYNKINGVYSSENKWLLTDVLRNDWGYEGAVMTDWGATADHVKGIDAGMSLEMPRGCDGDDLAVVQAVREGRLSEEALNREVERMLRLTEKCIEGKQTEYEYDAGQQHHMARRIARETMVLLKNDGGLLPIRGNRKVAVIGEFAEKPRYQGGGSSHIRATEELSALEALRSVSAYTYAKGFNADADTMPDTLYEEALETARNADIAILFLGLPDAYESEGYDRTHMRIPACQEKLLNGILDVQKNVCVVLHNGAPVEMPWAERVPAILEAYLGGQAAGGAVVDLLFGAVSPCAKLAETFPLRLEDNPSWPYYPGFRDRADYAEGIWVGYRWYDIRKMDVLFPFGHGLSYTTFEYSDLKLSSDKFKKGNKTEVSVRVTNTGHFPAKETVQFYVRPDHAGRPRPVRELKGIGKIFLQPGESGTVTATLDERSFACWDEEIHDWFVESGRYIIEAAASSRDIRLSAALEAEGDAEYVHVTPDTLLNEILSVDGAQELLEREIGADFLETLPQWFRQCPFHGIRRGKTGDMISTERIRDLCGKLNALQHSGK